MAMELFEMIKEAMEMHSKVKVVMAVTKRAHHILNVIYKKANINDNIEQQLAISKECKAKSKSLLFKYKSLFDRHL